MIASRYGFHDVDVEPDVGTIKLTASGNGMKITVRGRTLAELAENLWEKLR